MGNNADDYEAFIASILSGIKESERIVDEVCFGRRNKIKGKSGQPHQIDVSFIDRSFKKPTLVLIECKLRTKKVSVDVPKILKYNATDISRNPDYPNHTKMIIVSSSGFQEGTKRVASFEQIYLHTVEHGPPFGFNYENIMFTGVCEQIRVSDQPRVVVCPQSEA